MKRLPHITSCNAMAALCLPLFSLLFVGCKNGGRVFQPLDGPGMEKVDSLYDTGNDSLAAEMDEAAEEEMESSNYQPEIIDVEKLIQTCERADSYQQYAVYVKELVEPTEEDMAGVYEVWLADERTGEARLVCRTNPKLEVPWSKVGKDAADVPIDEIVTASEAWLAPGDVSRVIVQGCADARNISTYIIDPYKGTAKLFPTLEGVDVLDHEKKEIILSTYGYYEEGGRYTYKKAYDLDGHYLRDASERERE